jgi:hypothetical protein
MRSWIEPRCPIESRVRIVKLSIQRAGSSSASAGFFHHSYRPAMNRGESSAGWM